MKVLFLLLALFSTLFASKSVNLLYSTQNDGTISDSSIWIVEMIEEAGKNIGVDVNFQGVSWSRGLELVSSGIADGIINASYKDERASFAVYPLDKNGSLDISKSLKAPAYYLYVKNDSPITFDGKSIKNLDGKIGAVSGYAVIDSLKALGVEVQEGINEISNLRNVLYGELEATAELENDALNALKSDSELKKGIRKLPIPVRKKEYFLIFSKNFYEKNKAVAEAIWDEISKLKNNEKYIEMKAIYQ